MLTSSLFLLASLACLSAAHPAHSVADPRSMLLRERRAVGGGAVMAGSFYSAPLRKQECENCNQLAEDHLVDEGTDRSDGQSIPEEVPALTDAEEVPEHKVNSSKAIPSDSDDEASARRKGGSKRNGSVYKNFFPMTFGTRVVRDVEDAFQGAGDVQANAKAEPQDEDDDDEDEDDDEGRSIYKNFFPMNFGVRSRYVREAEAAEGGRGSVISIANSFSKGRGAVASSSATAYGVPSGSSSSNNNNNNNNNNNEYTAPPALE